MLETTTFSLTRLHHTLGLCRILPNPLKRNVTFSEDTWAWRTSTLKTADRLKRTNTITRPFVRPKKSSLAVLFFLGPGRDRHQEPSSISARNSTSASQMSCSKRSTLETEIDPPERQDKCRTSYRLLQRFLWFRICRLSLSMPSSRKLGRGPLRSQASQAWKHTCSRKVESRKCKEC